MKSDYRYVAGGAILILLLCIAPVMSASDTVASVRPLRNVSAVAVPAVNPPQQETDSFVQSIINPIIRVIPGMSTSDKVQALQPVNPALDTLIKLRPVVIPSKTSPCADPDIHISTHGKIPLVGVTDYDSHRWYGLLRPYDSLTDIIIISDDPYVLTQMQTAVASGSVVVFEGYRGSNPESFFKNTENLYNSCEIIVISREVYDESPSGAPAVADGANQGAQGVGLVK